MKKDGKTLGNGCIIGEGPNDEVVTSVKNAMNSLTTAFMYGTSLTNKILKNMQIPIY